MVDQGVHITDSSCGMRGAMVGVCLFAYGCLGGTVVVTPTPTHHHHYYYHYHNHYYHWKRGGQ